MSQGFSEEEARAIQEQMARLSVDDVLLQSLGMLIDIGVRKAGLAGAPEDEEAPERDLPEAGRAIDGARAILDALGDRHGEHLGPIRNALSQLQLAYVQLAGGGREATPTAPATPDAPPEPAPDAPAGGPERPSGPGPAESSGRLWVPGSDPRP